MSYLGAGHVQIDKTGITIVNRFHLGISFCAQSLLPPWFSLLCKSDNPALLKRLPESSVLKDKGGLLKYVAVIPHC